MYNIKETLEKFKKEIESHGHTVYAIMLKGSQNYNLSDEESDIDANAILIPTLSEIRKNKSYKYSFSEGEVVCHNIYSFAEIVAKGNPQWVEVCNTKHSIGESLEHFSHFNINPSALKGMIMEKVHAFDKPYPSREKYVKQFGYDPKQLHHIIRLYDTLHSGFKIGRYYGIYREWMMQIKRGTLLTKEEAFDLRDEYVQKLNKLYKEKKLQYKKQDVNYEILDKIVLRKLTKWKTE